MASKFSLLFLLIGLFLPIPQILGLNGNNRNVQPISTKHNCQATNTPISDLKSKVIDLISTSSTSESDLKVVSKDSSKFSNVDSKTQLISAIALIAGTTVGAGILALPAVAAESGFIPSSITLIGAWIFMTTTGLLIAEVCCNLTKSGVAGEKIGILSMVRETLGGKGAVAAGLVYAFIHYALLVAYIAEAGDIITDLLNIQVFKHSIHSFIHSFITICIYHNIIWNMLYFRRGLDLLYLHHLLVAL